MKSHLRRTALFVALVSLLSIAAAEPETAPAPDPASGAAAPPPADKAPAPAKTPETAPKPEPTAKDAFKDLATRLLARPLRDEQWLRIRDRLDTAVEAILIEEEIAAYKLVAKEAFPKPKEAVEARFKALLETLALADGTYFSLKTTLEEILEACLPAEGLIPLGLKTKTAESPPLPKPADTPKTPAPIPTATLPEGGDSHEVPTQPAEPPAKVPTTDNSDPARPMPTGKDPTWDSLHDGNVPIRDRGSGTYVPELDNPSYKKDGSPDKQPRVPNLDNPTFQTPKTPKVKTPKVKAPKVKKAG